MVEYLYNNFVSSFEICHFNTSPVNLIFLLFQCRSVKIMIMGDEGVPVQVDGEAWIQAPRYFRIMHKNRAQMLTRDRVCT